MAIGETVDQGPEELRRALKPHIPLMQTLAEGQLAVLKRRKDDFKRLDGRIISAFKSQLIFCPSGENFMMPVNMNQIETGDSLVWVEPDKTETNGVLVPVLTSRQQEFVTNRGLEIFDFLSQIKTGLLDFDTGSVIA